MTKVKICGNTNVEDVKLGKTFGADFLGFIFAKSKRQITPEKAALIIKEAGEFDNYVGVFANQPKEEVEGIAKALKLKWLQFHGEERSRYCHYFTNKGFQVIKTFHIKDALSLKRLEEYDVSAFLFDTYSGNEKGGTGKTFDWKMVEDVAYVRDRLFLAGGLTVHNVQQAIASAHPYAIDVASGVEKSPGIKDPKLLKEFIQIAKEEKVKASKK